MNYLSNASPLPSDRAGGNATLVTFGLRSGYTNKYISLKAYLCPGILSYDHAYQSSPSSTNPSPTIGRIPHFTTALGIDGDISINRHLALRAVSGNTPVCLLAGSLSRNWETEHHRDLRRARVRYKRERKLRKPKQGVAGVLP